MPVFDGITSSSATEVANNIPSGVLSFSIANTSGGGVTVNLYIGEASAYVRIVPKDLALDDGDTVYNDNPIKVLAGKNIFLTTTGTVEYYFSIS
jgi:hypothetical protein